MNPAILQLAREVSSKLRSLDVVNAASLRAVRRELSSQLESASSRDTINLAFQIIERAPPGAYPVMYELLAYHPTAMSALRLADLTRLGKNMSGWGEVDCFSYLAGVAWRNGQISQSDVHKWARSDNRWWRRAALVSTVPLNMKSAGGRGDANRTLALCRLLLDDRDDMVVKAMSWALRALATRDPKRVEEFVEKHQNTLARRASREVRNKLRTGRKDGRQVV
ncbi:DNA alkylation repair protein [Gemmatimonadota bacterium]